MKSPFSQMSRAAKGIIVVASIVFVALALLSILRLHFVFWIYTDIASWLSVNLNLDDTFSTVLAMALTAALVPAIPYFFWYIALGRHAMEAFIITVSVAGVVALLLHRFGEDVYFHPRTGEPLRYYASTPTGVVFSRGPGYDKKFRTEFKPVIPEIIASLERQKLGIMPKKVELDIYSDDLSKLEFFSPVDGSPKYFYYALQNGEVELFDGAGFHPQYREPLKPVDQETIARLKSSFQATKDAAMENAQIMEHYIIKDNIVIDKPTGLMWLRCSVGQQWSGNSCVGQANKYRPNKAIRIGRELGQKYRWGGYADWRVPTVEDLKTLVKLEHRPTINPDAFPNTPPESYWSSSIDYGLFDSDFWCVDFNSGDSRDEDISIYDYAVRLVRHSK